VVAVGFPLDDSGCDGQSLDVRAARAQRSDSKSSREDCLNSRVIVQLDVFVLSVDLDLGVELDDVVHTHLRRVKSTLRVNLDDAT
jgi:hypothetical protein